MMVTPKIQLIGTWTLIKKELIRFWRVAFQTVAAPVITGILYLVIFSHVLQDRLEVYEGVTYTSFLIPGLIMMSLLQNAFANTSSSILISKVQGNIVDVLMPPLSEYELTFSYSLGGVTRGLLVGLSVSIVIYLIVPIQITNLFIIIYFALFSSLLLSLLGILCGIWAKKFDHMASVTNFIILPLTFLSGTFYSIERLPEDWRFFAYLNPFFYIIDGFRYGFVGVSDSNISLGIFILAIANLIFLILTIYIFKKGYGLRN